MCGSLRAAEVVGMKTVLHLNPDLHVNQVLYILYMLVGPKSPSYIPLLSQAHQIEYYDH